ncbi:hypothetical protein MKW98_010383 [Papaver atlanticum]|uniref:Uncharacterized protein n=1 Tax=Papaver atlanticum TaxID=357466 RepID=A0AAD4SL34_9MAGN|nr:hypothetical protein MKW98_010383 [Papaver atlanticum]
MVALSGMLMILKTFLESIKNYLIPEEFAEDGVHTILIVRTSAAYRKAAAKPIPDELIALQQEYMVYLEVT